MVFGYQLHSDFGAFQSFIGIVCRSSIATLPIVKHKLSLHHIDADRIIIPEFFYIDFTCVQIVSIGSLVGVIAYFMLHILISNICECILFSARKPQSTELPSVRLAVVRISSS
jgi:hypothetical protein